MAQRWPSPHEPAAGADGAGGRAALLEALVAVAPLGVAVYDHELRYVLVNPRLARMHGVPAEDHAGRRVDELGLAGVTPHVQAALARAVALGRPVRDVEITGRKAGSPATRRWVATYVPVPVRGATGVAAFVTDVTEPHAAGEALRAERDYAQALVAALQDGMAVISADAVLSQVNDRYCEITGHPREALEGARPPYPHWDPAEHPRLTRVLSEADAGERRELDARFRRPDGAPVDVIISMAPLHDATGRVWAQVETVKDVTERRTAELALRAYAAEQGALARLARLVAAGRPAEAVFAETAREVRGLLDADLAIVARFEGQDAVVVGGVGMPEGLRIPAVGEGMLAELARGARSAFVRDYATLPDDAPLAQAARRQGARSAVGALVEMNGRPWGAVAAASGRPGAFGPPELERLVRIGELASLALDATAARAELAERATRDGLTGLPNHSALQERMRAVAAHAARTGEPVALAMLDVDHFKDINDTHGHPVGDRVLAEVARRLRGCIREQDTLARVGGEEFAWLMPGSDADAAVGALERARRCLSHLPIPPVGHITVSAGVSDLNDDASDGRGLYERADHALYGAKRAGRDRVVRY